MRSRKAVGVPGVERSGLKTGTLKQVMVSSQRGGVQVPLLTVGKDATVRDAMAAMLEKHVHRVYVVEDPEAELPTPLAVVTTSDMMDVIAQHSQS